MPASLINGLGGWAGFGENALDEGDDGSSDPISLTPVFSGGLNFFGRTYTSMYVNNNGNITFSDSLSSYTPSAFSPTTRDGGVSFPIIAPFWGDVDTRGDDGPGVSLGGTSTGSNQVWYDLDRATRTVTVTWDDVGVFPYYEDDTAEDGNAFQVRLIGRGGGDFDIEFRYENIEWTVGSASGGQHARAGYSAGDNLNFFELPQSGDADGMYWLDAARGNTGEVGVWRLQVRSGDISNVGDNGNNIFQGSTQNGGQDWYYAGLGNDSVDGGIGADQLYGGAGNDWEEGGLGDDMVDGGYGDDRLYGEDGDDGLYGGLGSDSLYGGIGSDTLDGGLGNDWLDGGAGSDTVAFTRPRTAYTVTRVSGDTYRFVSVDGTDTVSGVEFVQFGAARPVAIASLVPGAPPTSSEPGNTLATARNVGAIASRRSFTDSISPRDTNDYYRFTLARAANLNLTLSGMRADGDLELLDRTGRVIAFSIAEGSANESITRSLGAGTYHARVYPAATSVSTTYTLQIGPAAATSSSGLPAILDLLPLSATPALGAARTAATLGPAPGGTAGLLAPTA